MKNTRQSKILEIIEKYEISTQDALIQKLAECGFEATQTTISRDIRQLKLVKGPTGKGSYKYVAPQTKGQTHPAVHNSALTDAVVKIEDAQNIVVVKTTSGMANAIAVCVDAMELSFNIVGSVAGDDTVLIVLKNSEDAHVAVRELSRLFLKR